MKQSLLKTHVTRILEENKINKVIKYLKIINSFIGYYTYK